MKILADLPYIYESNIAARDSKLVTPHLELSIIDETKCKTSSFVFPKHPVLLLNVGFYNDPVQGSILPFKLTEIQHLGTYVERFPSFLKPLIKPIRVIGEHVIFVLAALIS